MKILVVDDNRTHLDAAKAQLSAEHEVTTAQTYDEAQTLLGFTSCTEHVDTHNFDAVLVDLLMPASSQQQGRGARFVGQEMPVGIFLAILAAKNGAKYVGLLTDSGHHDHPASACLDAIHKNCSWKTEAFPICGARVVLSNDNNSIKTFHKDNLATELEYEERQKEDPNHVRTKDWRMLLARLLSE